MAMDVQDYLRSHVLVKIYVFPHATAPATVHSFIKNLLELLTLIGSPSDPSGNLTQKTLS